MFNANANATHRCGRQLVGLGINDGGCEIIANLNLIRSPRPFAACAVFPVSLNLRPSDVQLIRPAQVETYANGRPGPM